MLMSLSSTSYTPIATFRDFSVFSPQKIIRGPSPHLGTTLKTTFSPLSLGEIFMKIRLAVPENGCLIFMHFVVADDDDDDKKRTVKHIRIRAT